LSPAALVRMRQQRVNELVKADGWVADSSASDRGIHYANTTACHSESRTSTLHKFQRSLREARGIGSAGRKGYQSHQTHTYKSRHISGHLEDDYRSESTFKTYI
jgi:hypothetical protein